MNPISEEKLKIPYLPPETLKILNSLAKADSQPDSNWMNYKYNGPNLDTLSSKPIDPLWGILNLYDEWIWKYMWRKP